MCLARNARTDRAAGYASTRNLDSARIARADGGECSASHQTDEESESLLVIENVRHTSSQTAHTKSIVSAHIVPRLRVCSRHAGEDEDAKVRG